MGLLVQKVDTEADQHDGPERAHPEYAGEAAEQDYAARNEEPPVSSLEKPDGAEAEAERDRGDIAAEEELRAWQVRDELPNADAAQDRAGDEEAESVSGLRG